MWSALDLEKDKTCGRESCTEYLRQLTPSEYYLTEGAQYLEVGKVPQVVLKTVPSYVRFAFPWQMDVGGFASTGTRKPGSPHR